MSDTEDEVLAKRRKGCCHCSCCHFSAKELKAEFGYCRDSAGVRLFGKWVGETTIHGVVHVFKGESKWRRLIWAALLLGALGGLTYNFVDRVLLLHSAPSQTDLRFDSPFPEGATFPAVTLCNLEQISTNYAKQQNLTDFFQYIFTVFPEGQGLGCPEELDAIRNTADLSKTLQEAYFEGGPQVEVFLSSCTFGNVELDCVEQFVPIMTQTGLCYTFNGDLSQAGRRVNGTGRRHGLSVVMNITSGALLPNFNGDQGVKVVVHPRGVPPEPDEAGIAVPPGRNAFVSLQASSFSDTSSKSQCGSVDLPFFTTSEYSLPACRQNYFLSTVHERCSCLDPLTGGYRNISTNFANTPECTIADACCVLGQYFTPDLNTCPTSCEYDSFETTVSYSKYPSPFIASEAAAFLMTSAADLEEDLVSLNVYFGELHTQVTEVNNAYDIVAFLSDFGGLVALFFGASIVSAIEITMFISDEIRACFFRKHWNWMKKKDRHSRSETPSLSAKNSEAIELEEGKL